MKYPVFVGGEVASYTELTAESELLRETLGIEAWINTTSSWPKWEACQEHNMFSLSSAGDPNEAIAECAKKVGFQGLRIRRPVEKKKGSWWMKILGRGQ